MIYKLQKTTQFKIQPDWLLIYLVLKDHLVLTLMRTGSHSDLF